MSRILRNSRYLLIFGLLLAALAFVLTFSLLSKAQSPASNAANQAIQAKPTPVPPPALIAKTDVPALTPMTDLKFAQQYFAETPMSKLKIYPGPDYVPGFAGLGELLVLGPRHLAIRVPAGQPLLASELISNTAPGAIDYSPLLSAGEVAEAVQVQPVAADNAGIQPSDHVDMLLSLKFDLTKDAAARHAFINSNGTTLTDQTSKYTIVGNLWETQTTLQNLRVLNSAANVYTLAMSHQDAELLKWVKDDNGTIDLVVRAADDSGKLPRIFETTAILPEYIVRDRHVKNHFVLP